MFRKDAYDRRRWASLAAVAVLLAVCLILLGGGIAAADEGPLPRRPVSDREDALRATPPGMDVGPLAAAGPQQAINPGFTVDLTYNAVWGLVDPGDTVIVNRTSDGAYGAAEADGVGFFWTRFMESNGQPADIVGGDVLEVYVDGALAATLAPLPINGEVDVLADQVAGTVSGLAAGTVVTATLGDGGLVADVPSATDAVDGSGAFVADFAGIADVGPYMLARVQYRDGAGHTVQGYLYPVEVFRVSNWDIVEGYAPGYHIPVTVTVYTNYPGGPRWSATVSPPWPHGAYAVYASDQGESIEPGDVVEVDLGGGTLLYVTAGDLKMQPDAAADQIVGLAPPGVTVRGYEWDSFDGYHEGSDVADGSGNYTLDLGLDLQTRHYPYVGYADAEGDEVGISAPPPHIRAYPEWSYFTAIADAPDQPVTYTLDTGTETFIQVGWCGAINSCDQAFFDAVEPGYVLTAELPNMVMAMTVADWSLNPGTANDEVYGSVDTTGWLLIEALQWYQDRYPVHGSAVGTANVSVGSYAMPFPGFDIRDGMDLLWGALYDADGHRTLMVRWGDQMPQFEVHPPYGVWGIPPDANEVVTATLYTAGGAELGSTSYDHDDDPWRFWFDLYGLGFEIEPGHWLTVTSESGWEAGLQVPVLTIETDPATDLIWGEGPKAQVMVEHGWDGGWAGRWVPVDGYALDRSYFGGDVQPGDEIIVQYQAPIGDRVRVQYVWPRMGVNYEYDLASGVYEVGHTFWLTVTESDGSTVKATATVETWPGGSGPDGDWWDGFQTNWEDWDPWQPDIQPGDWVHYQSDDGYSNAVQVGTISGELDADADTVWGTVSVPWFASQTLEGVAGTWGFTWESFALELDAAGEDDYYVDFSPEDLLPGWDIDVKYEEPDLDYVVNVIRSPELAINVNYGHDWVQGEYEVGHTVWVTVTDEFGAVKATAELETELSPWGWTGFQTEWDDWDPEQPDIAPDDWVYTLLDNGYASTVQVGTVSGDLDLDGDTVAGNIYADWFTETLNANCSVWEEGGPGTDFTVDPDGGSYFCDIGALGWDLQAGDDVAVQYQEPDGDWVINVFSSPWMRVNYGHDWVGGNYPAGHGMWLVVTDESGAFKASATVQTESGRGWGGDGFETVGDDWSPQQPDIQAGDSVHFESDDGYSNTIEVGEIRGTVDLDDDSVSGPIYADWFAGTLEVQCHPWGAPEGAPEKYSSAAPDGSAPYSCQWDPVSEWDIQANQDVAVMYIEPDDADRIINVFRGGFQVYLPLVLKGH
jgi:hypothetical protein